MRITAAHIVRVAGFSIVAAVLLSGCELALFADGRARTTPAASVVPVGTLTPAGPGEVSVAVAGDMACWLLCPRSADVGSLVADLSPDAFLPPGDLLNNTSDWSIYDHEWGALKPVTYPVPGNHEYTAGIEAYDEYWGAAAHAPDHYYSFELGSWHIVALNGELDMSAGSPMETWFQADLAANPVACTAVLLHQPRWSSAGEHPSDAAVQALWSTAVDGGVDLWLSGHDHLYERFVALDADGIPHEEGTTQFVIGTGGRPLHGFGGPPLTGEAARDDETYGAGLFVLGDGTWRMSFVPIPGQGFTDSASGECH